MTRQSGELDTVISSTRRGSTETGLTPPELPLSS